MALLLTVQACSFQSALSLSLSFSFSVLSTALLQSVVHKRRKCEGTCEDVSLTTTCVFKVSCAICLFDKQVLVYEEAPILRPIIIMGPSLKGFEVSLSLLSFRVDQ